MGAVYLTGMDMHLWESNDLEEFVCLRNQRYDDFLSSWIRDNIVGRFHFLVGKYFRVRCQYCQVST